jgi:hypothetical protein
VLEFAYQLKKRVNTFQRILVNICDIQLRGSSNSLIGLGLQVGNKGLANDYFMPQRVV